MIDHDWHIHLDTLDGNLGEVKRGLENGLFGPRVPLGHPDAQKWANAALHLLTVECGIEAVKELKALRPALRSLVQQWRQEAAVGYEACEPDAYGRATVWEACADQLAALLDD